MATQDQLNTLERHIAFCREQGGKLSTADDPYAGLMWHEDAEALEGLHAALSAPAPPERTEPAALLNTAKAEGMEAAACVCESNPFSDGNDCGQFIRAEAVKLLEGCDPTPPRSSQPQPRGKSPQP